MAQASLLQPFEKPLTSRVRKSLILRACSRPPVHKQLFLAPINPFGDKFRVADVHDESVSRRQKPSRRALEKRVHKILRCFSSRSCLSPVVPLRSDQEKKRRFHLGPRSSPIPQLSEAEYKHASHSKMKIHRSSCVRDGSAISPSSLAFASSNSIPIVSAELPVLSLPTLKPGQCPYLMVQSERETLSRTSNR